MNRVVVFGIGQLFRTHIVSLERENDVVAIVDNAVSEEQLIGDERKAYPTDTIKELEFDYVVIFNKYNMKEIYVQLTEKYGVPKEKIIGWQDYIFFRPAGGGYRSEKVIKHLVEMWKWLEVYAICDYGLGLATTGIRGREFFEDDPSNLYLNSEDFELVGCTTLEQKVFGGYRNLYDAVLDESCVLQRRFEFVLILDAFLEKSLEETLEIAERLIRTTKYLLLTVPYDSPNRYEGWNVEAFSKIGEATSHTIENEMFLLIRNTNRKFQSDVKLYVVTHKEFEPKYPVSAAKIRVPIQAGCAINKILSYQRDDVGDNVSKLNPYINECTAMYWVWKNTYSSYVGFEHYRRVLLARESRYDETCVLEEEDVVKYLEKYDFIVSRCVYNYPKQIGEEIRNSIQEGVYDRYYAKIKARIRECAPDYLDAFDTVFNGYSFYPCNLFVTRWECFDEYCRWLFDIILEVVDEAELNGYDSYTKRVVGFFAERLLAVWLLVQDKSVKELYFMMKEQ